ncbi:MULTISPECIES: hypothetical protein, partial [Vibrio]|uniref:hypothetical protein n=1 Tax=Vibrio TaxID=662 RepID=UPI001CDC3919
MYTPIKFYISLPFDLFWLGRNTKAKFDYIRTTPPRDMEAVWDFKIYNKNGIECVDCKSGRLSPSIIETLILVRCGGRFHNILKYQMVCMFRWAKMEVKGSIISQFVR